MNDEILLVQNESGKFEKYEPYAEIVCNTEAEFEKINEAMRQYQGWIDINDRLPDPEEYVLVSFENFTLPDIGSVKQRVMDPEHFIREMKMQAMYHLEYLLMHGCHCRKYTGERRQNHDYQICKIRELGKEPEESNYWKNQKRVRCG